MARQFLLFWIFLGFSSLVFSESQLGHTSNVSQLRQDIFTKNQTAQRVLKQTVESFLKKELPPWQQMSWVKNWETKLNPLKKLQEKLDKLGDVTLASNNASTGSSSPVSSSTTSNATQSSGRFTVGWNLRNDLSKLEYKDESLSVGLYQPRTLNAIRGVERFEQTLTFNLNKRWEEEKMTASFQMPWSMPYYQATVTKDFSTTITSAVSAQAPLKGTQIARKFEIKIALIF